MRFSVGMRKPVAALLVLAALPGCALFSRGSRSKSVPEWPVELGAAETQRDVGELRDAKALRHFMESVLAAANGDAKESVERLEKAVKADPESTFLRTRLARAYLRRTEGGVQGARRELEEAVRANPEDVQTRLLLAGVLASEGQNEAAIEQYEEVIRLDPKNRDAYLYLGEQYGKTGQLDKAVDVLRELTEKRPKYFMAHWYLGRVLIAARRYGDAEVSLRRAAALNNDESESVLFDLATAYEAQGKNDPAIEIYKKLQAADPSNSEVRRRLGRLYVGERRLDDAIDQYRELEKVATDPGDARTKIGVIYLEKGDFDRALTEFSLVLTADPDDDAVRYYRGVTYSRTEDYPRALEDFSKVPVESDYYPQAIGASALLQQKLGKTDEAIATIEKAVAGKEQYPDLQILLASLYRDKNDLKMAIEVLSRLSAGEPGNDEYLFRLGAYQGEAKEHEKCVATMRKVIELNPTNAAALNYLGYTFAERGENLDEAEALIRQALDISPHDGFYIDSLGWVLYQRGDYEGAVEQLERARNFEPASDDATIAEHLGDAYSKTKRRTQALEVYMFAFERAEDKGQADRIREKIEALGGSVVPKGGS